MTSSMFSATLSSVAAHGRLGGMCGCAAGIHGCGCPETQCRYCSFCGPGRSLGMSHSIVALSPAQIEANKVRTLGMQASNIERQIQALITELGKDMQSANFSDRSVMGSEQLAKYIENLLDTQRKFENLVQIQRTTNQIKAKEQEEKSLLSSMQRSAEFNSELTSNQDLATLQQILSNKNTKIQKLRAEYKEYKRKEAIKVISETLSKLNIEQEKIVSAGNFAMTPNSKKVQRNDFPLEKNKDFIINKVDELQNPETAKKFIDDLEEISNRVQYDVWFNSIKREIARERVLLLARDAQADLTIKVIPLPSGPSKNDLQAEIELLSKIEILGDDYEAWEDKLQSRIDAMNNYIDREMESLGTQQYVTESLIESLAEQGIHIDSRNYIDGNNISMTAKIEGNTDYGISVLLDPESNELTLEPIKLSDGENQNVTEIQAGEIEVCPKIYSVFDSINIKYGIKATLTKESAPIMPEDNPDDHAITKEKFEFAEQQIKKKREAERRRRLKQAKERYIN